MKYSALDRAKIVVEAWSEWYALQDDKPVFKTWLRMQGIDINGDRYEWKPTC
jgi:hypothetical protein